MPDNDRNVYSALQRRLHLCGKGTYCVKLPAMEASLIEKIITYIDSSKENAIPYVKIYQKFKKDLKACGYTNEYMLHGYLNELYSDAYSSRNYLKKAQYAKYDIKESSYMVVASSNKPVSIDYIQKEIGNFNETVIFNALSLDERVVLCGSSTFALAKNYELAFSDYILAKSIITDCLKERGGYCKDEMLFQHFKSKSKILNKYKINNPTLLYSVINTEFRKDYLFQRPLLYDKNVYTTTFDTYFDLLRAILENGGYIKFSEYLKALKSDCISSPAFWIGKFRMFYTPIDEDLYMNPAFFIAEKYIDATSVLKDFTAQSEYTLISKTFDFSKYGKGKVNWNNYLLYSFAKIYGKRYGYSVIEPEYYTRSAGSINKALIVRGGLENISYNDLAYKLILEDGEKTYTAYELQRYLELKEFLQGKVPMSLTSHEKISCKDGIFTVNC